MANTQTRTGNEQEQNICVVVIYITQRAQRAQSFNFLTVHAGAGDVASFTATGEHRDSMTNKYSKQILLFASLCALLSCVASDPSQAITFLKFFALSASSACGNKTSAWWLYISRKERRERGEFLISHTEFTEYADFPFSKSRFTLALESTE